MGRVSDFLPSAESFEIGLEKDKETIYIEWCFNLYGDFDRDLLSTVRGGAVMTVWFDEMRCFTVQCNDCNVVEYDDRVVITCNSLDVAFISKKDDACCGMWVDDDVFCDLCYDTNFGSFSTIDIYLGDYVKQMKIEYDI